MSRIVVLSTGGTIAMRHDPDAGGAVPQLGGADLLSGITLPDRNVSVSEFGNIPSSNMTVELLWALRERIRGLLFEEDVAGVVVTHGTDTMEESAYLADLTLASPKPVVFTGAMRTASDLGYDGHANLAAALYVAASDQAQGLGALIVFADEIHAARYATKVHTQSVAAFASPGWGPLGRVTAEGVQIPLRVARDLLPTERLEPRVLLVKLAAGMESDIVEWAVAQGMRGLVLEALGGGRVPPWWMPSIRQAIAAGVSVVVATRSAAGKPFDRYGYAGAHNDLAAAGALFSGGLSGPQARIRLMAALGNADAGNARRAFPG